MTVLGVLSCFLLSRSLCSSSTSAHVPSIRDVVILRRLSGLLSLLCCSILCSCYLLACGADYAYADDVVVIDEVAILERSEDSEGFSALPVEYRDMMLSRSSGDEYVTMDTDTVQLRSVSAGDASATNPAWQVVTNYLEGAISSHDATLQIMDDLAWRYYNSDNSMRDKIPVQPKSGTNALDLSDFDNWGAWDTYVRSNFPYTVPYRLVGFDDNKSWTSSSPNAILEYEKWYNYYNGIVPDGGGSGNNGTVEGSGIVDYVINYGVGYGKIYKNLLGTSNVTNNATVGSNFKSNVEQYLENYPYVYYWAFQNSTASNTYSPTIVYYYLMSDAPISVTGPTAETGKLFYKEDENSNGSNHETTLYSLGISTTGNYKLFSKTNVGIGSYQVGATLLSLSPFVSSYNNSSGTGFEGSVSKKPCVWVTYAGGGSSGGNNNPTEPVYPTYPDTNPQPTAPTAPTAPTYSGDTYNITNNVTNGTSSTTTDLQPILDAIRTVNDNLDEFESNLLGYLDTFWSNLRGYLDAWFTDFSNWFDVISTQLDDWFRYFANQYDEMNRWLKGIFYKLGSGATSDEPDVTIQPDDFWDWLGNVLTKYTDIPQDFIDNQFGDFVNLIRQLTGKFPFSVPWDIAYMLGLLSHTPVTPAFNFWMPSISNGQIIVQGTQVSVDLAPFDGVAAVCRRCELFLFAIGLTKMTFKTLQDMEWTIFS